MLRYVAKKIDHDEVYLVTQSDIDIQLKVWKDLAISKQILMGAATEALGLDAECSTDELREALNKAISRAKDADINITNTREQTDREIAEMREKMEASDQARVEAESLIADAVSRRENAERQLAAGKQENSEAIKKARSEINEKQNQLKAISKALADSPENVIKKLKTLKKQKLDESKLKTLAETKLQKIRKEKTQLEADLEEQKTLVEAATGLAEQYKQLHELCSSQHESLKTASEDPDSLTAVPDLDQALIEQFIPAEEEK